jgi:iron(II)-dependent oxidoreductase
VTPIGLNIDIANVEAYSGNCLVQRLNLTGVRVSVPFRTADNQWLYINAGTACTGCWVQASALPVINLSTIPITVRPPMNCPTQGQVADGGEAVPGGSSGVGTGTGVGGGTETTAGTGGGLPTTITPNGVPMSLVAAGCFQMGNDLEALYYTLENTVVYGIGQGGPGVPDGGRQCINSFYMDVYEVTQRQFRDLGGLAALLPAFSGDDRPRENVTWYEANAFCASRGARLPTEAEWEYAARGPENRFFPWGNSWNSGNLVWKENSGNQTANVGSYPGGTSWSGIQDMLGNVEEWTSSQYQLPYPYVPAISDQPPVDPSTRMSMRGLSYTAGSQYPRSASRSWLEAGLATQRVGFRCVHSA